MPTCYIQLLTSNGTLQSVDYTPTSLADAVQYEPIDGVYTITNTYNTYQVLKFDAHLDRLENSARLAKIPFELNRAQLRSALRQIIHDANFGDVRFRITVPPTAYPLIISVEPFIPISNTLISNGVRCLTTAKYTRNNPTAKTTDWMFTRQSVTESMPKNIYDTILLDSEGNLLEGLGSNFYAFINDALFTAEDGVLPGISRQIIFEIAPNIQRKSVNIANLEKITEAFITSSSRGIVPVIEIDHHVFGDGKPGPHTLALLEQYREWVARHLEDL